MPSDHRLTAQTEVDVRDLAGELFIGASDIAGPMRSAIENYLATNGLDIKPTHRIDNLTMAMSLIASTRRVALLPAYAENLLPWSVTSRPLKGKPPTIDLVIGYNRTNTSPILQLFLSRVDQLRKRSNATIEPSVGIGKPTTRWHRRSARPAGGIRVRRQSHFWRTADQANYPPVSTGSLSI